ncbi:hypothetical protein EDB80DRAFT_117897 [Ilyonectria destructans]|nr:hypothetical protein EDB80DRAFT_117897 [Ilyonectria destructans]
MYFLYKRRQWLVHHLESMVLGREDDFLESLKPYTQGVSLSDKMSFWYDQAKKDDTIMDKGALFKGVKDMDDEEIPQAEISAYKRAVFGSAAYSRLIATISNEQWIDRGGTKARALVERIRNRILDALPTGSMSKRRLPTLSGVVFRLQWRPWELRLEQEGARHGLAMSQAFSDAITVTGSSDVSQATTIRTYLYNTWPSSSINLLLLLQQVTDGSRGDEYLATLPNNTQIGGQIQGHELIIAVGGPTHSIAECGEQLAWLAAALPLTRQGCLSHRTPSIIEAEPCHYPSAVSSLAEFITFDIDIEESIVEVNSTNAHCLQRMVGNPSTVLGFPTIRRPKTYFGLEIDITFLLSIITITEQGVFLNGSGKRLDVFKQTDNIILWHLCHSSSPSCPCCIIHFSSRGPAVVDTGALCMRRHIVDWCENPECITDGHDWRPSINNIDLPVSSGNGSLEHQQRSDRLDKTSLCADSPQSRTNTDSADASFESDLFSESGTSEDIEPLDKNGQHFSTLTSVLQSLISGFRETTRGRTQPSQADASSRTGSGISRTTSVGVSTNPPPNQNRKRQGRQNNNEDSENEDLPPPLKRAKLSKNANRQPRFACPYWKRNSSKHHSCFSKTLRRIRDVKQHLTRKHTPEFYCECCFEIFTDGDEHQIHITHVAGKVCIRGPSAVLEGISHQQHRQLSRKPDPKLPGHEQWFSVWDILFPGSQRPTSAYHDSELSAEISGFREYCSQYGPPKLDQALQNEVTETEKREHLITIFQTGLNQLFDTWHSNGKSSQTSSSNAQSSPSQSKSEDSGTRPPPSQPTPNSSLDTTVLTTENPVANTSQFHASMPNPLPVPIYQLPGDILQPPQLSLGDVSNGYSRPLVQGILNDFSDFCSETWPLLDEPGLGETPFNPNVCGSVIPDSSGLDIEELLNFNRF